MAPEAPEVHPLGKAVSSLDADLSWVEYRFDTSARSSAPDCLTAEELLCDRAALASWQSRIHAARVSRYGSAPERVAAGDLLQQAADILAWLGAALLHREALVPLAPLDRRIVRIDDAGQWTAITLTDARFACLASDARAGHPDARPVADHDALTAVLRAHATEAGRAFVAVWTPPGRMGPRIRWGAITDALDSAPWSVSEGGDVAAGLRTSASILARAEPPLIAGTRNYLDRDAKGRVFVTRDRHACCFEYLLPETPACFSCPRTPREERRRRAGEWPDEGPPD